ncbi:MAG: endonuclease V [Spirosomataceae bacterium]
MIAVFDVDYKDKQAQCACLLIEDWQAITYKTYKVVIDNVADYESGSFYKRELPCLLQTLSQISEPIDCIVVDSYVTLGEKKGLGAYLYEELPFRIPIIGVAKTKFLSADDVELLRGESVKPLYITSLGIEQQEARLLIEQMAGEYRLPFILKEADRICRIWDTDI